VNLPAGDTAMKHEEHYRKLENLMHSAPIVNLVGARVVIGAAACS